MEKGAVVATIQTTHDVQLAFKLATDNGEVTYYPSKCPNDCCGKSLVMGHHGALTVASLPVTTTATPLAPTTVTTTTIAAGADPCAKNCPACGATLRLWPRSCCSSP